jgi:hypothetical protein
MSSPNWQNVKTMTEVMRLPKEEKTKRSAFAKLLEKGMDYDDAIHMVEYGTPRPVVVFQATYKDESFQLKDALKESIKSYHEYAQAQAEKAETRAEKAEARAEKAQAEAEARAEKAQAKAEAEQAKAEAWRLHHRELELYREIDMRAHREEIMQQQIEQMQQQMQQMQQMQQRGQNTALRSLQSPEVQAALRGSRLSNKQETPPEDHLEGNDRLRVIPENFHIPIGAQLASGGRGGGGGGGGRQVAFHAPPASGGGGGGGGGNDPFDFS